MVDLYLFAMEKHPEKLSILTCYYKPKPGGLCKRLFRAINALLLRGHDVHYLSVIPFPIEHPNLYFHRFPWPQSFTDGMLFWLFFHLVAPFQLFAIGIKFKIDRSFAFGNNYGLFLQPLRILKNIPIILFVRADSIENSKLKNRNRLLILFEQLLEGLAIQRVNLCGVSDVLTEKVTGRHRLLHPAFIQTLRNDIQNNETDETTATIRKKFFFPIRLGCVGILEPRKNQRFLLDVMKSIDCCRAALYCYGIGSDESFLKNIVETENLSDRVFFMGWVEAKKIWECIDILLMPSLHEGAPNAVLEAIGAGITVLASDIPEHREILPPCSLLPLHVEHWVKMICQKESGLFTELSEIRLQQALQMKKFYFDWDQSATDIIVQS